MSLATADFVRVSLSEDLSYGESLGLLRYLALLGVDATRPTLGHSHDVLVMPGADGLDQDCMLRVHAFDGSSESSAIVHASRISLRTTFDPAS